MFHFIFDEHLSIALDAWSLAKSFRLMFLPQVVAIHPLMTAVIFMLRSYVILHVLGYCGIVRFGV